jgi:hypothetical protein
MVIQIVILLTISSIGNDSIYTEIKKPVENMDIIEGDINSSTFILPSPKGYIVSLDDGGGRTLQLSIEDDSGKYYTFHTEVLPNVIEWRINNSKIIGFIIRSTSSEPSIIKFKKPHYKSKLHVVIFNNDIELIDYETNNTKARSLLDCEYEKL